MYYICGEFNHVVKRVELVTLKNSLLIIGGAIPQHRGDRKRFFVKHVVIL